MIKKISSLFAISLLTFLFIFCTTDEEMLIGPVGNTDNYLKVTKFSADKTQLYSFEDSTKIRIKVMGVDNSPIEGLVINFNTQIGKITESSTTDESGLAVATFVTNEDAGTNIITADSGIRKDTLSVHVFHYQPKYVELSSETPALLADGISKTSIIAVVKDSLGNPMDGRPVTFTTTLGGFGTPIKQTDENGIATVELTSGLVVGTATIVASSPPASGSINIEFFEYSPSFINLTLTEKSLLADGNATVEIKAQVLNEIDEPMVGVDVLFSTTLGSLIGNTTVKTNHDGGR